MAILTFKALTQAKHNNVATPVQELSYTVGAIGLGLLCSIFPIISFFVLIPVIVIAAFNAIRSFIAEAKCQDKTAQFEQAEEARFSTALFCGALLALLLPYIGIPLLCWAVYRTLPANPDFRHASATSKTNEYEKNPPQYTDSSEFKHNPTHLTANSPSAQRQQNGELNQDGQTDTSALMPAV